MTDAELFETTAMVNQALADRTKTEFTLVVSRPMLGLILDCLQHMDPDMPPAPMCKALGPLVGDVVMNRKLQRLDDIVDALGPNVLRLAMIADQLERRRQ